MAGDSAEPRKPVLLSEPREGVPGVVDTAAGFDSALAELKSADGPVAADAERASGYRYSHEDYLIQIKRVGTGIFLFDVPALLADGVDLSRLTTEIPGQQWILHDASQDLPSFADVGIRPASLFDTEFAARFLGLPHVDLSACTESFLGLRLAKEHAAADWSYRPLPRDWRNYAALDVELLIQLREKMAQALRKAGKADWGRAEFAHILSVGLGGQDTPKEPWRHTSHITALGSDRRALAVVRQLWTTRDRIARSLDIAPTLLLRDSTIIRVAQLKPRNARQFAAVPELSQRVRIHTGTAQDKMFERYAPIQRKIKPRVWKQAVLDALQEPRSQWPAVSAPRSREGTSVPRSMKYWRVHQPQRYARLEEAKQAIETIARRVRIPSDLLVQPRILRSYFWSDDPNPDIDGFLEAQGVRDWQRRLVNESLKRVIMEKLPSE
ncbi:MAG: HRDC domain-containing protein [Aeriscardovia sp.]|nr:HRDC domain-containing protein [Aeriscardovia sp.]